MSFTRRSALTVGAAALASGTSNLAAIAAPPDPIFELIDAHHRADENFSAVLRRIADLQEMHGRVAKDHPMRGQLDAMEKEASDAEHDALFDVLELPATTAAGLVAGLRYLQSLDPSNSAGGDFLECCGAPEVFFDGLAAAIERVAS
jgi:hypothetical protein